MTSVFRRNYRSTGFTLIELLVVVAIISLLVSIMLPSLSSAKELARRAVCRSQQRSVALAMTMYASENDSRFPVFVGATGYSSNYDYYVARLNHGGVDHRYHGIWGMIYNEYVTGEVFYCPSDDKWNYDQDFPSTESGLWSSTMSYGMRGVTPKSTDPVYVRFGNFNGPTTLDDPAGSIISDRFMWARRHHDNVYNYAFSDGSSRSTMDYDDFIMNTGNGGNSTTARLEIWKELDLR